MIFDKSKKTTRELGKEIAENILNEPDRINMLVNIFHYLPRELTNWFFSIVKGRTSSKTYVEIDLSHIVDMGANIIPGDLVIRKNRDPKIEDFVEICQRDEKGYYNSTVKVKKIDIKDGKMLVYSPLYSEQKGEVSLTNIVGIIDKVIKYKNQEWEKIMKTLNIEYEDDEILKWNEDAIANISKMETFFEKENTIKKLEERIKIIKIMKV